MSGLIWIQTVWHIDGIAERNFRKVDIEKIFRRQKKHEKLPISYRVNVQIATNRVLLATKNLQGTSFFKICPCIQQPINP